MTSGTYFRSRRDSFNPMIATFIEEIVGIFLLEHLSEPAVAQQFCDIEFLVPARRGDKLAAAPPRPPDVTNQSWCLWCVFFEIKLAFLHIPRIPRPNRPTEKDGPLPLFKPPTSPTKIKRKAAQYWHFVPGGGRWGSCCRCPYTERYPSAI